MTQPKPLGFGVFADGKEVAHLSVEQLRAALARFDELNAARVTSHSARGEHG